MISKLGLVPRKETLKALTLVLVAMGVAETIRMVLFQTILLGQPVGKVALVAVLFAVLARLAQQVIVQQSDSWIIRAFAFCFACAGAFMGYLPAFMVFGRPLSVPVTAFDGACVICAGATGVVSFYTLRPLLRHAVSGQEAEPPEVSL
jgi:uncharacterized membrane protein